MKINTMNKKSIILKSLIGLLLFIAIILSFKPVRRAIGFYKETFNDYVYQNYISIGSDADIALKSIAENNLTLNIYDVVFENQEIVLKYDLRKDNNTVISNQAIYSFMVNDNNQSIQYKAEYNALIYYSMISENTSIIYLIPSLHRYDSTKEKEKITPIDKKLEIILPKE